MDMHHFGNLDPHQVKIRIRIHIKVISWILKPDPDPNQFADGKTKCMEYEPILALFQGFKSPYLEAKIWTRFRIRIKVKSRIRIRINKKSESGSASG
jgi:hypothetical protein